MDERTDAKRTIESSTRHMTDIAQELSRRASPRYLGEQAKQTARNMTRDLTSSPLALALLGGALGAAIGGTLARNRRRQFSSRDDAWREVRYPPGRLHYASAGPSGTVVRSGNGSHGSYGPSVSRTGEVDRDEERGPGDAVREKISEGAQQLKDTAADTAQQLKDKASSVVDEVRERIPSAAELRHAADENPGLVALGGFALGAIAALLLPVSRKERDLLEPVKQRAGEAIGSLGEKLGDTVEEAQHKLAPRQDQSRRGDDSGEQRSQPAGTYRAEERRQPSSGYASDAGTPAREPYASEDPVRGIGDDSGTPGLHH
jgi:hypothetical protein